jgi:hypothetical protein
VLVDTSIFYVMLSDDPNDTRRDDRRKAIRVWIEKCQEEGLRLKVPALVVAELEDAQWFTAVNKVLTLSLTATAAFRIVDAEIAGLIAPPARAFYPNRKSDKNAMRIDIMLMAMAIARNCVLLTADEWIIEIAGKLGHAERVIKGDEYPAGHQYAMPFPAPVPARPAPATT